MGGGPRGADGGKHVQGHQRPRRVETHGRIQRAGGPTAEALRRDRLERAIGVVYRPRTERVSHYFHCRLPEQFDAVIHIDETSALIPLDRPEDWHAGEVPETYPTGI